MINFNRAVQISTSAKVPSFPVALRGNASKGLYSSITQEGVVGLRLATKRDYTFKPAHINSTSKILTSVTT